MKTKNHGINMKKVIRLNENDVEKLVRKIISEEKKSINEGPLGWIRKKFNRDEELGLLILKGLEKGNLQNLRYQNLNHGFQHQYNCNLDGHEIESRRSSSIRSGSDYYHLSVDGEFIEVSDNTNRKIFELLGKIESEPALIQKRKKLSDAKTRLSAYNLPDEERKKIEDSDTFFQ